MILIGQYDSPFVRRVGIALTLYGLPFRHEPWSVGADAHRIRPYNPLTRVPVLVLDDGEAIIDSAAILDHLDRIVGPGRALFPQDEPARRRALRIAALACGTGDKAVSLFYELAFHDRVSESLARRCRAQILDTMALIDDHYAECGVPGRLGHEDIAVACVWRHATEAHPGLIDPARFPALARLCAALEALPVFRAIAQPFVAPA